MIFTLENDKLYVTVSDLGAELQTLTATNGNGNGNEEYLWHGDSNVWSGRAPILFPIVGSLKDSQMSVDGKSYSLPRHGFARRSTFECIKSEPQRLVLRLKSDGDSRSVYPWDFSLEICYALSDNRVNISYSVTHNNANASDNMLFTIGSHPAFSLPLNNVPLDHFAIRFSHPEKLHRYPLDSQGLLSEKGIPFSLTDNQLVLQKHTFDDDALVFKNINSTTVSLWQGSTERVRLETGGAPHLGLWAKPGAPYVCIEPWYGYSDSKDSTGSFTEKSELKSLAAGDTFTTEWAIVLPLI